MVAITSGGSKSRRMHLRHVGVTTAATRIFNNAFLQWCQFSMNFLGRLPHSVDEIELLLGEFVSCLYQQHRPFQGALEGIAAVRRLIPILRSGTDPAKVHV